jgi:hypothetical protein
MDVLLYALTTRWRKFITVKDRFRPLLLKTRRSKEDLPNMDIAYGVQMPLVSALKTM